MERRSFILKAGALFSLPLIITEIGCDGYGDSNTTAPDNDDNNNDNGNSSSFSIESSVDSGHSHSVNISQSNVDNPPASNVTLTTICPGHTHKITLTQSDYESLMNGNTIFKTSTLDSGHTHTFSIKVP